MAEGLQSVMATKWQYRIVQMQGNPIRERQMNQLGDEGWEYVGPDPNGGAFIYRRPAGSIQVTPYPNQ